MKKLSLISLLFAAACSGQPSSPGQAALSADSAARSFGIASYAVEGDTVRLLDAYGMELGTLTLRDAAESRLIDVALANGYTDEIEVYRPVGEGRFMAPISRDFTAGAALADAALAPVLATHGLTFTVGEIVPNLPVEPSILATTTSCTSPSSDTPDGCARPANTSLGCTNPSQLPATVQTLYTDKVGYYKGYTDLTSAASMQDCTNSIYWDCYNALGGPAYSTACMPTSGSTVEGFCYVKGTRNTWTASCPRQTCATVGQYDAVPRYRQCDDPGSCTKSQGTVGCTTYH